MRLVLVGLSLCAFVSSVVSIAASIREIRRNRRRIRAALAEEQSEILRMNFDLMMQSDAAPRCWLWCYMVNQPAPWHTTIVRMGGKAVTILEDWTDVGDPF